MKNINIISGNACEYPRAGWLLDDCETFAEVYDPAQGRVLVEYCSDGVVFIEMGTMDGDLFMFATDTCDWDYILESLTDLYSGIFYSVAAGMLEHGA